MNIEEHNIKVYPPTVKEWGEWRHMDVGTLSKGAQTIALVWLMSKLTHNYDHKELSSEGVGELIEACLGVMGTGLKHFDPDDVLTGMTPFNPFGAEMETKTKVSFPYIVVKAIHKLHMSTDEVLNTSYFKIQALLDGMTAIEGEKQINDMQVARSTQLMKSKEGQKQYADLVRKIAKDVENNSVRKIVISADLSGLQDAIEGGRIG